MMKRLGYYRKSAKSNKLLIRLFEINQRQRFAANNEDWADKEFTCWLWKEEIQDRRKILGMLRRGEVQTADDFYRAGHFFHHGSNFRDYALGLALFAVSRHLGELWGKNSYAVALDRFLIFVKQPQYFGTQFEKHRDKWLISSYRRGVSDRERKEYFVETLAETKKRVGEMNQENY